MSESLIISLTGCIIGIILTFPTAEIFSIKLGTYFPVFNVANKTIFLDILAAVLVGSVLAVFPTCRAINIRIADGLRCIG